MKKSGLLENVLKEAKNSATCFQFHRMLMAYNTFTVLKCHITWGARLL